MRGLPALLIALAATGCVAGGDVGTSALESADEPSANPFLLSATDCDAGGFISSYGGTMELAGIWTTADIRDEIGNPLRDSMGMPVTGPLFGNWHIGIECATAEANGETAEAFEFGWVGEMVEAPAWDEGGADMHFLLTGLAFDEGPIAMALRDATTADITHVEEVTLDWLVPKDTPRSAISARFVDRERGVYESYSTMQHYRDTPDRVIRFWWQVPADGSEAGHGHEHTTGTMEGKFHPMYFDLRVSGGPHYVTPPIDMVEVASHNMLKFEHGPTPGQPCTTAVYEHATLEFTIGRTYEDVELGAVWTH